MFEKFFDLDRQYVGFFKFLEDPEMVPGHLVIRKNNIEGQLYRAPKDIIERPDLPLGFGLNTKKVLNATGVFRLRDGKDFEVSIFGIQIGSYSSSQLGFYEIYCRSMILKGKTLSLEEVLPKKLILNIMGLEEWFEKKAVQLSHEGNRITLSSENRIIETIYASDQITIDLECYANFSIKYRDNIVKEIIVLVIHFHESLQFTEAEKWIEKFRQIFSLFFRKQLNINEVSFFIPNVEKEFYYVYSDSRDFYGKAIKHRSEAIVQYSDDEVFKKILKNFLHAEPRLKKLMDTFFLMELNHSLYNENAFLTWVFELDSFIKKGKQKGISREESVKGFSKGLITKIQNNEDPLLEELVKKWHALSNEKAKFYEESLQTRLIGYFGKYKFFKELISTNPEEFFERIVKTRNHLAHPTLKPGKKVIAREELYTYQTKLRLLVYCLILLELGMNEELMIERLKAIPFQIVKPLT